MQWHQPQHASSRRLECNSLPHRQVRGKPQPQRPTTCTEMCRPEYQTHSGPNREHTYHCYEHHTLQHSSRIDDIYIFSPQKHSGSERCMEVGGNLDHKMLVQHIPAAMLQMAINPIAPQAPQKQAKQLQYPVPKEALLATKHEIDAQLTTKLEQTAELIRNAHDMAITMLDGNHTAKQIKQARTRLSTHINVGEMAEDIMALMHQAHDIMLETCPNKTPFTKTYMPRTVGKEYEKLNTQIIELKRIRQETNTKMKHPQCTYTQPKTTIAQEMLAQCQKAHINQLHGIIII